MTRALAAALLAPLLACGGAAADTAEMVDTARDPASAPDLPTVHAGDLTVSRIVAPAPVADGPMALYLAIANAGAAADTLLGIVVADGDASVHETTGSGMRRVERLVIPAGATVALRPGGLHGMIEKLATAPAPGDTLRATLRFARAGDVAIATPVVAYADLERVLGAAPGADAHAGH